MLDNNKELDQNYNEIFAKNKELQIKIIEFKILNEQHKTDRLDAQMLIDQKINKYEQGNKDKIMDIENEIKKLKKDNIILSTIIKDNK